MSDLKLINRAIVLAERLLNEAPSQCSLEANITYQIISILEKLKERNGE